MKYFSFSQTLLLAFIVVAQQQLLNGQLTTATATVCSPTERCVRESYCKESEDAGHGIIEPRLDRPCGKEQVCCNLQQLQRWNARMAARHGSDNNATTTPEPSGNEICGLNKECVPRKLCSDNVIVNDGRHLLSARMDDLPCTRVLHVCCAVDQKVPASQNPYLPKLASFKYQGCGHSNPQGLIPDQDSHNIAKDESLFGQFPWMVALITGRNKYLCGGTLIHPQLVLTSAHNIINQTIDTLVARMGEWDLSSMDEPHEYQSRRITQIIRHEEFDSEVYFNDIALLVLDEPLEMQPHIQPLCLPAVETPKLQSELRDAQCYATGWGSRTPDSKHEQLLKRIDLPVISRNECQGQLRLTRLGQRFRLRPSFICAGGIAGKDTCKGDGGSPLFCTLPGQMHRYQMAGIVSWGIQCNKEDVPAVYANVPYLRNWIDEKVKSLNFVLETP